MQVECICGAKYHAVLAPCPDGNSMCDVAHYDKNSFVCPSCGQNNSPNLSLGQGITIAPAGVGLFNLAAVRDLKISS